MEFEKQKVTIEIPAGARHHDAGDLRLQIGKISANF